MHHFGRAGSPNSSDRGEILQLIALASPRCSGLFTPPAHIVDIDELFPPNSPLAPAEKRIVADAAPRGCDGLRPHQF
jgi:hypothetical protein